MPDPDNPGKFYARVLKNVLYEEFEELAPSKKAEYAARGVERLVRDMDMRTGRHRWI